MTNSLLTCLIHWDSVSTLQALAWALLHFLWQGIALAALAAATMAICHRAQTRYLVACAILVLMFLAPVATFSLYLLQPQGSTVVSLLSPTTIHASQQLPGNDDSASGAHTTKPHFFSTALAVENLSWLVEAWLLGVVLFGLRAAGGFLLLGRRRRQSSPLEGRLLDLCLQLQCRLGIRQMIQYCECVWLQAPALIGWFRPVVFLPVSALTGLSEEQLKSVIVHELAHVKRFDPFVNVFQVCVETLLFYHPAVWWLNERIRAEREICCDETAVSLCGNPVDYARALTLMEEWRDAPEFAMAANRRPVTERVIRILGFKTLRRRSVGFAGGVLCLSAALIAGNALLGIAHPKTAMAAQTSQANPSAAPSPSPEAASSDTHTPKPSPLHPRRDDQGSSPAGSYIDAMKAAGIENASVDELIGMKIQDVTPEYVRGIEDLGLHPNAEALIGLRVQGITPEYIRDLRAAGLNPDLNQVIALKVQGADANYYRELKQAGIDSNIDRLIALRVQGVTPEYVRGLRAEGLQLTADDVIGMKIQDITPSYVKGLRDLGLQASAGELIGMRIQGVTPEYVHEIQALGYKPSTNQLIAMRVQDVTPSYIKALQTAGFQFGVDEIIRAKIQDVTPDFIERARQHGFKDLNLNKLIQLRQLGILDSKADL